MSEHKRTPRSASERQMARILGEAGGALKGVRLKDTNSNSKANSSTDNDANNDKDLNP